jgi:hypothetical protein
MQLLGASKHTHTHRLHNTTIHSYSHCLNIIRDMVSFTNPDMYHESLCRTPSREGHLTNHRCQGQPVDVAGKTICRAQSIKILGAGAECRRTNKQTFVKRVYINCLVSLLNMPDSRIRSPFSDADGRNCCQLDDSVSYTRSENRQCTVRLDTTKLPVESPTNTHAKRFSGSSRHSMADGQICMKSTKINALPHSTLNTELKSLSHAVVKQ